MVVYTLAKACGLDVPDALVRRFNSTYHTFLVKRFDRTVVGRRRHFASAMNLTGHQDGDDASTGASYLEIAQVLMTDGARTDADLRELWSCGVRPCASTLSVPIDNGFVRIGAWQIASSPAPAEDRSCRR
jgi:hypothetical protein